MYPSEKLGYAINKKETPWDSRVFNINTYQIDLDVYDFNGVDAAVNRLNDLTNVCRPSLFYCRVDANNSLDKLVLIKSNFFNCETQFHVTNYLNEHTIPKEIGTRRLPIAVADHADYDEVAEKAMSTFIFSRFHEDPFIDKKLSDLRMTMWCKDMKSQNIPLLVSRGKSGALDSFIFYKFIDEKKVELILGGSLPGKGALTPLFWASFMDYFRSIGVKFMETKISASNVSIVNIYSFFNFKIKSTYFDFHKHVSI